MRKKPGSFIHALSGLGFLAFFMLLSGFEIHQSIDPIEAGKQIYTKGTSPSGKEIIALLSGVKMPAAVLPCVNCHGADGAGRPEGGVTPSNLQWDILTKNNGGQSNNRKAHPPYTDKSFKKALTMGIDPGNSELLKTMPRYQLSQEDFNYLLAYLKVLGKEKEKGIDNSTIKTGFVLPPETQNPAKRLTLQKVLAAYFSEINLKGGIYNRKIEPIFATPDFFDQDDSTLESCFAIGNCWNIEAKQSITNWASKREIPIIGAISSMPISESLQNRYVFYLYPGLKDQAIAQLNFLNEKAHFNTRNIALVHDGTKETMSLTKMLSSACEKFNPNKLKNTRLGNTEAEIEAAIHQFKKEGMNTVFYFCAPGFENDFFRIAHKQNWYPDFFCLGNYSDIQPTEIPQSFDGRIFLAFPNWLDEFSQKGWDLYKSLKVKYDLPDDFQNMQLSALGAAMIYVEAVRNCGRKITREKLISNLEKLYEFKTGLIPPISYGLNSRIGSQKVYIVSLDLEHSALQLETIIKK